MKRCTKCGELKLLSDFHKRKSYKDGIMSWCKKCHNESGRKWATANSEKMNEHQRKWYSANPDKSKEKHYKWRAANPDKARKIARKWDINHPEQKLKDGHNRRARKMGNGGEITIDKWKSLKEHYKYTCLCCKRSEPEIKLTIDHVKPIVLGGKNLIKNAQPLCQSCNSKKGVKYIDYR